MARPKARFIARGRHGADLAHITRDGDRMAKITVKTPVVELDGDAMTRTIGGFI